MARVVGEGCIACEALHIEVLERESKDTALYISVAHELNIVVLALEKYTCLHAEPDTRMTAMAAFPEAVESA